MVWALAIAERSVLAFGLILFIVQNVAHAAGFWLGQRHRAEQVSHEAVGVVVGGMLGLLAFVLALTLSFANGRFNEHRQGSLAEANAMSTTWLRAKAIGTPEAEAIATLVEDYARVRADFVAAGRDQAAIDGINQRTSVLQNEIWAQVSLMVRAQPNPVTTSLMAATNDMFDATTKERFAFSVILPPQLFWLLIGMTLLSMACLGYQFGLKNRASHALILLLTLMWTWVIVEILDLASARVGAIRTGTAVYEWTIEGFEPTPVPPAPAR
ncbi:MULTISPECIES: bestrophin-like domain [unclassified Xanthobacter]|uniref:bestrophin-like domain n=1 Tax=unclassified Xanthobacter TaxID=2623496 RepID=UPI001EE0414D|nr:MULTISPECIES: hypothetical protein [unclassified Xanthobacter]